MMRKPDAEAAAEQPVGSAGHGGTAVIQVAEQVVVVTTTAAR